MSHPLNCRVHNNNIMAYTRSGLFQGRIQLFEEGGNSQYNCGGGGEAPSETCERRGGSGGQSPPQIFFKELGLRVSI